MGRSWKTLTICTELKPLIHYRNNGLLLQLLPRSVQLFQGATVAVRVFFVGHRSLRVIQAKSGQYKWGGKMDYSFWPLEVATCCSWFSVQATWCRMVAQIQHRTGTFSSRLSMPWSFLETMLDHSSFQIQAAQSKCLFKYGIVYYGNESPREEVKVFYSPFNKVWIHLIPLPWETWQILNVKIFVIFFKNMISSAFLLALLCAPIEKLYLRHSPHFVWHPFILKSLDHLGIRATSQIPANVKNTICAPVLFAMWRRPIY